MTLKSQLSDTLKDAMRARDSDKTMVLRSLQAAIKQIEIDTRTELDDDQVLAILQKQLKQRRESLKAYTDAQRPDLAEKEQYEATIIESFMPKALTEAELEHLIQAEIMAQQASSIKDMGKVMNALRPKIMGRADAAAVSAMIKARLN